MKCVGFPASGVGSSTRLPRACGKEIGDSFLCSVCAGTCLTRGFWLAGLESVQAEPYLLVQDTTRREVVAALAWNNGKPFLSRCVSASDLVEERYGHIVKNPGFKWPLFFVTGTGGAGGTGTTSFTKTKGLPKRGWSDTVPVVDLAREKPLDTVRLLDGDPVIPSGRAKTSLARLKRVCPAPVAPSRRDWARRRHIEIGNPVSDAGAGEDKERNAETDGEEMEKRVSDRAFQKVAEEMNKMKQVVMRQIRATGPVREDTEMENLVRKFNRGKREVEMAVSGMQRENTDLRGQVRELYGIVNVLKRKFDDMQEAFEILDDKVADVEESADKVPDLETRVKDLEEGVVPRMGKDINNLNILLKRIRSKYSRG